MSKQSNPSKHNMAMAFNEAMSHAKDLENDLKRYYGTLKAMQDDRGIDSLRHLYNMLNGWKKRLLLTSGIVYISIQELHKEMGIYLNGKENCPMEQSRRTNRRRLQNVRRRNVNGTDIRGTKRKV